jgi:hypothetical protein
MATGNGDDGDDDEQEDFDDEEQVVYGAGDSQLPQFNLLPRQPFAAPTPAPPAPSAQPPQTAQPGSALARLHAIWPKHQSNTQGVLSPQVQARQHPPGALVLQSPAAQPPVADTIRADTIRTDTIRTTTSPGIVLPPFRGAPAAVHNSVHRDLAAQQQQGCAEVQVPHLKDLSNHMPPTRNSTSPPSDGANVQGATVPEGGAASKQSIRICPAQVARRSPTGTLNPGGAADGAQGLQGPRYPASTRGVLRPQDKPGAVQAPPAGSTISPALSLQALLLPQPRPALGKVG